MGLRFDDGKVEVLNLNPRAIFYIPRRAKSELAPHAGGSFKLRQAPADKLGHWREELIFDAFGGDWLARKEGRLRLGGGPRTGNANPVISE